MTTNKKLLLITFITIVIPLAYSLLFNCFSKGEYFYEYTCNQLSFLIFSVLPLIGGVALGITNYKSGYKSVIWYLVSVFIIIINTFYLYSLYSLSNFGF